jgi:uncharacterized membrane protein
MLNFISSLKHAFNDSIGHMNWAIVSLVVGFSLVIAFAEYQAKQAEKKDKKFRQLRVKALFMFAIIVFFIIGTVNILYTIFIFDEAVKGGAGIAIGVCTVIAAVNAGIITWGIKKENKK